MKAAYSTGVCSSVGIGASRGGRTVNEDNYLIYADGVATLRAGDGQRQEGIPGDGLMVAVADGMGGHAAGDVASEAAVRALTHLLMRASSPEDPEAALRGFVAAAHARLYDQAQAQKAGNMGTTLTVAWILDGIVSWVNVGDSRVYLQRGDRLQQLSCDQTRAELARRDGRPPPREPDALAQAFIFGSRGLGDDRALRLDEGKDTGSVRLQVGDRLLLCSDGVHGWLSTSGIDDALRAPGDLSQVAAGLVERAMRVGSDDNLTAVLVQVDALDTGEPEGGLPLDDIRTLVPDEG